MNSYFGLNMRFMNPNTRLGNHAKSTQDGLAINNENYTYFLLQIPYVTKYILKNLHCQHRDA